MSHPIPFKLLHPLARPLVQASSDAAGYDLQACLEAPLSLRYGENAQLIPTGIAVDLRGTGLAALIVPRGGPGHRQGLVLGNGTGVLDASTLSEWFISAWNRGPFDEIVIRPGDRIAQVLFVPVVTPTFVAEGAFALALSRDVRDNPLLP